jgi:type III secretory pathway component EscT
VTGYQVATLIAFLATLLAAVVLLVLHLPEPAVITTLLGSFGLALLPSINNRANVAAVQSMHPPPLVPRDDEHDPPKG